MRSGRQEKSWQLRVAITGLSAAALIVVFHFARTKPEQFLAQRLNDQLKSVSDDRVDMHIRQIAQLGEPGIPFLVTALDDSRPAVAKAAHLALHQTLDRCQLQASETSADGVAELARLLALGVDGFGSVGRAAAGEIAHRLLLWPAELLGRYRVTLVADCEQVFRVVATDVGPVRLAQFAQAAPLPSQTTAGSRNTARPMASISDFPPAELPGGDLPIQEVELPPLPPSLVTPPELRPVDPREPQLIPFLEPNPPRILFSEEDPDDDTQPPPMRPLSPAPVKSTRPDDIPPSETLQSSASQPLDPSDPVRPARRTNPSDLELFRRLHSDRADVAFEAAWQLGQKGFRLNQIAMAEQMTSPDVQSRREFAQSLARQPASDCRWLLWISQDSDPLVRQTAVSIMATARDPLLIRRLMEMQYDEPDQRVRDQLDQWSRTRRTVAR